MPRRKVSPQVRHLISLAVSDPTLWHRRVHGALEDSHGNVSQAARVLGISTRSLWRWISEKPSLLHRTGHQKNRAFSATQDTKSAPAKRALDT